MITRHIADLLYHHECVIVPGLGGFIKAYQPAQIVHSTHGFYPPSGTVAFNAGLSGNDGQLANYIASAENTSYREALYELKLWSKTCLDSINKGEKVVVDGIGELFMNSSGKLEFSPSKEANFNPDSFGLPVFFAKAVNTETLAIPEIQLISHSSKTTKLRRIIPETLKWAAVLAPFIAFILWGSINSNIIDNYVHNYSGMFSWVRSTPGKTATVKTVSFPVQERNASSEVIQSPGSVLASENSAFNPGMVSYTELDKNEIKIAGSVGPIATESITAESITAESITADQKYFIIGGAFREHSNAINLISMLRNQGYPATVVDTTAGGLYVVSMKGFNRYDEAVNQLSQIKESGFPSSWILKKQKG